MLPLREISLDGRYLLSFTSLIGGIPKRQAIEGPSRLRPFEFDSIKSNLAVACRMHFVRLNANHIEAKLLITNDGMGFYL